jgi:hypothetical protein
MIMALSKLQIMALSDARCGIHGTGLEKCDRRWLLSRPNSSGHDNKTIISLVERGYLQLYARGSVAHITDMGMDLLSELL